MLNMIITIVIVAMILGYPMSLAKSIFLDK